MKLLICVAILLGKAEGGKASAKENSPLEWKAPLPLPQALNVSALTVTGTSGAAFSSLGSPCGGDIALPATTNNLATPFTCANRLDYNLQLTLSGNTAASAWALYIAWGDACSPTATQFNFEVSTVATAALPNPFLTGFCLANQCCGAYSCRSPPCAAATLSVDYTPPSTAVCSENNQAITGFGLSTSRVLGLSCINVANNYDLSFTLSNPFPEMVSVFTASGSSNCGLFFNFDSLLNGGPMPTGFTPSASAIATRANSFQLTSRCTDEPCCAIVW